MHDCFRRMFPLGWPPDRAERLFPGQSFRMRPQFQPDDANSGPELEAAWSDQEAIDSEAYDASEQHFAASLEKSSAHAPIESVPEPEKKSEPAPEVSARESEDKPESSAGFAESVPSLESEEARLDAETDSAHIPDKSQAPAQDFWRQEVADRLNQFRARRRPRAPRYPSLQLKFDPIEPMPSASISPPPAAREMLLDAGPEAAASLPLPMQDPFTGRAPESGFRLIEFPRSSLMPPGPLEELAEPVLSLPRILDVPETAPAPPALGGILMEPKEAPAPEKRPGIEIPLQPGPLSRRLLAAAADAALVLLAVGGLGGIVFKMVGAWPPPRPMLASGVAVAAVFWAMYQYLFLVYSGTTPGLWAAGLRVSRFDGSAVPRRLRRWRVLASLLSAVSLGLGYAWCLLDEDGLCWHDRTTRTYLAPFPPAPDRGTQP
jgi:uncharacterized RDD family membrane protein YckC